VQDELLVVELSDGSALRISLDHYPRLRHTTPEERAHWRLIGLGGGIHWPELDEDLSVGGLLAGRPSAESRRSLDRWLAARGQKGAA
jgi:hypothetical protein